MLQGRVTRFSPPGSSSSAGAGVLSPDPRPELGDATRALSRDESPARRDFDGRERAKRLGDWPGVTATKRSSSNAAAPKRSPTTSNVPIAMSSRPLSRRSKTLRGLPVSLRPLNAGWSYPSPFELVSDEPPAATVQDRRAPHPTCPLRRDVARRGRPHARVEFVVASRPGFSLAALPERVRDRATLHLVPGVSERISATDVRRAVRCGQQLEDLVDPAVAAYIYRAGLYRAVTA